MRAAQQKIKCKTKGGGVGWEGGGEAGRVRNEGVGEGHQQHNTHLGIQQQVFRLEVSVHDVSRVEALQCQQHVGGVEAGCCVAEGALYVQMVEQLPARHPLLQDTTALGRHTRIVEKDAVAFGAHP